jgi:hypothetical protein
VAITTLQREAFASLGTLSSGTPGGLGTVSGSFVKRPVGPRLTGDGSRGWSAIAGGCGSAKWSIGTSGGQADTTYQYFVEVWLYVDSYNLDSTDPAVRWLRFLDVRYPGNGSSQWCIGVKPDGTWLFTTNDGFTDKIDGTHKLPLRTWVQLRLCFQMRAGGFYEYDIQVHWRPLGGSWTTEFNFTDKITFVSGYDFYVLNAGNGGSACARGCLGMPGLYQTTAASDGLLETPGVVGPDGLPTTWYVASGGSDAATGLSGSPWLTPTRLDDAVNSGGGILTGDTIVLDGVVWDGRGIVVPHHLDGLTFAFRNNAPVFTKNLATATWALEAGTTAVYSTTHANATDLAGCVVIDAGVLLSKLPLNAYANAAALVAALDATPGSSWDDGTKLYVHTSDGTNPGTNGRTYRRTAKLTDRDGNAGASAILMHAPGTIDGGWMLFDFIGDASSTDGTGLQTFVTRLAYASGTYVVRCMITRGWTKHAAPCLTNASDAAFVTEDLIDFGGLPFGGFGAATSLVDYAGADGLTGCSSVYRRIRLIGLAVATGRLGYLESFNGYAAYLTHQAGSGSPTAFGSVAFEDVVAPAAAPVTLQAPVVALLLSRSRVATPTGSVPVNLQRCRRTPTGYRSEATPRTRSRSR